MESMYRYAELVAAWRATERCSLRWNARVAEAARTDPFNPWPEQGAALALAVTARSARVQRAAVALYWALRSEHGGLALDTVSGRKRPARCKLCYQSQ